MTGQWVIGIGLAIVAALVVLWLAMFLLLARQGVERVRLVEGLRLLPDLVVLMRRLAGDSSLPRGVRVRLVLLLAYLVSPIDLVPDFIPVLGHLDDAVVAAFALRSVIRRAGVPALRRHWPGTPEGLASVERLTGLSPT